MTVKELIKELQTCPENYEVMSWMSSGEIEEIFGISVVCDDTKSIALSGKINYPPENMFKLEIIGIN